MRSFTDKVVEKQNLRQQKKEEALKEGKFADIPSKVIEKIYKTRKIKSELRKRHAENQSYTNELVQQRLDQVKINKAQIQEMQNKKRSDILQGGRDIKQRQRVRSASI